MDSIDRERETGENNFYFFYIQLSYNNRATNVYVCMYETELLRLREKGGFFYTFFWQVLFSPVIQPYKV